MAAKLTKTDQNLFADPIVDSHLRELKPRQRQFIELMVWKGLSHIEAAQSLNVPERTARYWMRHPAMLHAIGAEHKVLRAGARARNVHRLEAIRDQDRNLAAAVAAARAIEDACRDDTDRPPSQRVGYVVFLGGDQTPRLSSDAGQVAEGARMIDVTPRAELTRSEHFAPAGDDEGAFDPADD